MSICNYVNKKSEKCKNSVSKDNMYRCSAHKKCSADKCDSIGKIKGYCVKHYKQIICKEQKKNCDSPTFLCDETFGDLSDLSEIEIGEGFFDKPICDLSESDINIDLPFQDELFEGLDFERIKNNIKQGIEDETIKISSKVSPSCSKTVIVNIKGVSSDELEKVLGKRKRDEGIKKDGRKRVRKSKRKSVRKSKRKSSRKNEILTKKPVK